MCCMKRRLQSVKVCGTFTFTVLYLFLLEVENEAHSPRAKPRQRPRDLSWRWKLVEHPDCLHGLPSRPQRRNDTNFTLRSLLETLIHKDNHCHTPFHLLREPCSTIKSIQGFSKEKKHMSMLAGPGSAEQLSSPVSAVHFPEHPASIPVASWQGQ